MHLKLQIREFSLFFILVLFFGCADENPLLVNPPSQAKTISIRFINLASDQKSRQLSLDGVSQTLLTAWGNSSPAINPPSDSATVAVLADGKVEHKMSRKAKYSRDLYYTYIGLPTPAGSPKSKPLDTLVVIQSSAAIPVKTNNAFIRMMNANPDSTVRYYLRLGCPNGNIIIPQLIYKSVSNVIETRSGNLAVSLVRSGITGDSLLGLFMIDLQPKGQYLLIVKKGTSAGDEFLVLDQLNNKAEALTPTQPVPQRTTDIRAINLSGAQVNIVKSPDEPIATDLQKNYIDKFVQVGACKSQLMDTLQTLVGSDLKSYDASPLEVLQRYTVMVFDSADVTAGKTIISEPGYVYSTSSQAVIKVVNADYTQSGISVSLGARTNAGSSSKFLSGESIASNLPYGSISDPVAINSGQAPITVFTSNEPTQLLYCTNTVFEAGKTYLLIVSYSTSDKRQVALISEDTENSPVSYLSQGVFTEIVHAVPGIQTIAVNLGNILDGSILYYAGSLATVVPSGSNDLSINGKVFHFDSDPTKRVLIVAAGVPDNIDMLSFINPPLGATQSNLKRRFVNACKEVPSVDIKRNSQDTLLTIVAGLKYGFASEPETIYLDQKASFYFVNPSDGKTIQRNDDISMPPGKNYTIIFCGSSSTGGYSAIIQQEF